MVSPIALYVIMSLMIYQSNPSIVKEFPFTVRFKDKRAIDAGEVAKDALLAFWEHACLTMFDGGSLLIPAVHHKVDMEKFPILGKIISHDYFVFLSALHFLSLPQAYLGHMLPYQMTLFWNRLSITMYSTKGKHSKMHFKLQLSLQIFHNRFPVNCCLF